MQIREVKYQRKKKQFEIRWIIFGILQEFEVYWNEENVPSVTEVGMIVTIYED